MSIKKVAIYQPARPYEFLIVDTDHGSFGIHFNGGGDGSKGISVCLESKVGSVDTLLYSRKRFLKTGRVA